MRTAVINVIGYSKLPDFKNDFFCVFPAKIHFLKSGNFELRPYMNWFCASFGCQKSALGQVPNVSTSWVPKECLQVGCKEDQSLDAKRVSLAQVPKKCLLDGCQKSVHVWFQKIVFRWDWKRLKLGCQKSVIRLGAKRVSNGWVPKECL